MSKQKKHSIYSLSEIYDYLGLKTGKGKKHQMEKEMQKDPFLADAVEGLTEVDQEKAQQDIEKINQKIRNQDKRSAKPLFFAAASIAILIIAGASYLIIQKTFNEHQPNLLTTDQTLPEEENSLLNQEAVKRASEKLESDEEQLAVTEAVTKPKADISASESHQDSVQAYISEEVTEVVVEVDTDYDADLFIVEAELPSFQEADTSMEITAEAKTEVFGNVQSTSGSGIDATESIAAKAAEPAMSAPAQIMDNRFVQGIVIDKMLEEPIAGAAIRLEGTNHVAITGNNGEFSILQPGNGDNTYLAQFVGMATEEFTPTGLQYQVIALNQETVALEEVIVTNRRSNRMLSRTRQKQAEAGQSEKPYFSPTPVAGFENYQQYLNETAVVDSLFELPGQPVIVKFELNNMGQPINLETTGPTKEPFKQKALEIISDGPLWTVPDNPSELITEPIFIAIEFKHRD